MNPPLPVSRSLPNKCNGAWERDSQNPYSLSIVFSVIYSVEIYLLLVNAKYQSDGKQRVVYEATFCKVIGFLIPAAHASNSDRLTHLRADVRHTHDLVSLEAEQLDLGLDLVGDLKSKISAYLRLVADIGESLDQDFVGDSFHCSYEL